MGEGFFSRGFLGRRRSQDTALPPDPRLPEGSQFDFDLLPHFLPQPTPTSSDSGRHASTRSSRKSAYLGHPPT